MKKIEFNSLPAGAIVLCKRYNLWEKFKALVTRKKLKYNDAWIDPFGGSSFLFVDTFWTKHKVFTFTPKKQYGKKEILQLFDIVLPAMLMSQDLTEAILKINLVRPNTFDGSSLEELLDGNKYYIKKEVK